MGTNITIISNLLSQIITFLTPLIIGALVIIIVIACAILAGAVLGAGAGVIAQQFGGGDCNETGTVSNNIANIFCVAGMLGIILMAVLC